MRPIPAPETRCPRWKERLLWALVVAVPLGIACGQPIGAPVEDPEGGGEQQVFQASAAPAPGPSEDRVVAAFREFRNCEWNAMSIHVAGEPVDLDEATAVEKTALRNATAGTFDPASQRQRYAATDGSVRVSGGDVIDLVVTTATFGNAGTGLDYTAASAADLGDGQVDQPITQAGGPQPSPCFGRAAGTHARDDAHVRLREIDSGPPSIDAIEEGNASFDVDGQRVREFSLWSGTFPGPIERHTYSTAPDAGAPAVEVVADGSTSFADCSPVSTVSVLAAAGGRAIADAVCNDGSTHTFGWADGLWSPIAEDDLSVGGVTLIGPPSEWSGTANEKEVRFTASAFVEDQSTLEVKRVVLSVTHRTDSGWSFPRITIVREPGETDVSRPVVDGAGPREEVPGEPNAPQSGDATIQVLSSPTLGGPVDQLGRTTFLSTLSASDAAAILTLDTPVDGLAPPPHQTIGPRHVADDDRGAVQLEDNSGTDAIVYFDAAPDGSGPRVEKVIAVGDALPGTSRTIQALGRFDLIADGLVWAARTVDGAHALYAYDRISRAHRPVLPADFLYGGRALQGLDLRAVIGGSHNVPGGALLVDLTLADLFEIVRVLLQSAPFGPPPNAFLWTSPGGASNNRINRSNLRTFTTTNLATTTVRAPSGLACDRDAPICFLVTGFGDGGRVYVLDPVTGLLTLLSDPPANAIPGAAIDPATGTLYGSAAQNPAIPGSRTLVVIDRTTGATTDVGVITFGGDENLFVDGLSICDGTAWGTTGAGFALGTGTGEIDLATGEMLSHQTFPGVTTTLAGLGCSRTDELYASEGGGGGVIHHLDPVAGIATRIGDYNPGSIPAIEFIDYDDDGLNDADEIAAGTLIGARDTDGDGVDDGAEPLAGTDLLDPDSDGDGLTDGYELRHGLDPLLADITSVDADADGLDLLAEAQARSDPFDDDTDDDGLLDGQEVAAGTSPLRPDTDFDGLFDGQETGAPGGLEALAAPSAATDPLNPDSDGDGMSDGAELGLFAGPSGPIPLDPLNPDTDGDGLLDGGDPEPAIPAAAPVPTLPPLAGIAILVGAALVGRRVLRR